MLKTTSFSSSHAFTYLALAGLLLWILALFLQMTNFASSDLGRHVMNGQVITESGQVFQNNLYSYTNGEFPAPNHHWLFGLVVYWIHQMGGFPLVTVAIAVIYLAAIASTVFFSSKLSSIQTSGAVTLLFLPIIGMRVETRPEAFSVLGLSIILILCHQLWTKKHFATRLFLIGFSSLVMLLWVNVHILFVLGLIVSVSYAVVAVFSKSTRRVFDYLLLICVQIIAALCNPLGWKTILYPLQILRDYQYPVAENKSIFFFMRYHPSASYAYLLLVLLVVAITIVLTYKRVAIRYRPIWLVCSVLIVLTAAMNRFSSFFYIPGILVVSITLHQLRQTRTYARFFSQDWLGQPAKAIAVTCVITGLIGFMFLTHTLNPFKQSFGLGMYPDAELAGAFFKNNQLPGPVFNNYDIGGYLIYTLYPYQKVFVDNRPEAYQGTFMTEKYIAAQKDESVWQQLETEYEFNTIFFYRHDATDWAMPFLIRRIEDDSWTPVYVDAFSLILLKNRAENQEKIDQFQLPRSMFSISKV